MDDLSGLSWSANSAQSKNPPSTSSGFPPPSYYRPTPPASGQSTPLSRPAVNSGASSKPATPANDSFANLVSFGGSGSGKGLSLAERQRQLAEQKAQEQKEKEKRLEAQYGGNNQQFWDNLEKSGTMGGSTLNRNGSPLNPQQETQSGREPVADDDDLLAAFNASAPVDKSTNFPIPSSTSSPIPDRTIQPSNLDSQLSGNGIVMEDNDDPFGLGTSPPKQSQNNSSLRKKEEDDDDVLGLLAKPVSEFANKRQPDIPPVTNETSPPPPTDSPQDRAIAELVDMGFPVEKARDALATTESGTDIQSAVGWLLTQAHSESRDKARGRSHSTQRRQHFDTDGGRGHRDRGDVLESRESSLPSRVRGRGRPQDVDRNRGSPGIEKDPAQIATEFGNNLFKSANSLWKTGTKRVQQAVQEFNAPQDPSQPRWMREPSSADASSYRSRTREVRQQSRADGGETRESVSMTDEAMLLESRPERPSKPSRPSRSQQPPDSRKPGYRSGSQEPSPLPQRPVPQLRFQREAGVIPASDSRSRLSRFAAEEEASQAYVSPARRRRPTPKATPDLQPDSPRPSDPQFWEARPSNTPPAGQAQRARPVAPSPQPAPRPKPVPRTIPPVQASTLSSSHQRRQEGSAAFKRGDYAAAHASYSSALSPLPNNHPVTILLLTNRALTALKIGEPKTAISDADRAIAIIGPSKGDSERIELGNGEPSKDMRELYGKALIRKAEALEQLEKWAEAASIWREAVESGHGGSHSIQGRNRCEKAAGNKPSPSSNGSSPAPTRPVQRSKPPTPKPARRPQAPPSAKPAEAVNRLRAANEAADRADNEKFALSDSVDARLTAWKGGKQDNLRALLGSLDTVLWPESGWKKISMADLVLPNKVKVNYMKGIAKVHPDKIPVNATTEQRMIAGAVFSTLNEAWDKFRQENGL